MALVLKIKHKETLRRWVVSQTPPKNSSDVFLTVLELELKVRELFRFAVDDALVITYVDKERDVVTLADDQDLVDACLVQGLNPLRLEVKIVGQTSSPESVANVGLRSLSSSLHDSEKALVLSAAPIPNEDGNSNRPSKPAFPQATAEAIKQFVEKYTKNMDPNLQPAVLIKNIQKALKDFVKTLVHEGQRRSASRGSPPYSPCPSISPRSETLGCSSSTDDQNQFAHHGVRCDGCNLHPIKGFRYKSTKVFNYDLCSACFDKIGNAADYQRIERPVQLTCHDFFHPSTTPNGTTSRAPMKWVTPFVSGSEGWKSECPFLHTPLPAHCADHPKRLDGDRSKWLDASYVKEVSNFNRAELVPFAYFTSILRLRNTGSLPWPQGTILAYNGGHLFALESAIDLKIPEMGLAVGLEFDVCIRMRAPEKAGGYISHWCLRAPEGGNFGEVFWIAIQVVEENGPQQSQIVYKSNDATPTVEGVNKIQNQVEGGSVLEADDSGSVTQSTELTGIVKADEGSSSVKQVTESLQFLVSAFADSAECATDEVKGFSMIEKPVDTGSFKMARTPLVTSQVANLQPINVVQEQYAGVAPLQVERQQVNMFELELMGFTNRNLNALLLEKNKQDLQLTLEDLLWGSGWKDLLKDLEDMGFEDTNTNLRLLIKNEGSIKRVVKELVEMEKL